MKSKIHLLLSFLIIFFVSCKEDTKVLPKLSFFNTEVNESEGTISFKVTMIGANPGGVKVNYHTTDGTAKAGQDYVAVTNGELVFAANETEKNIVITLINDTDYEDYETFSLILSNPVNATIEFNQATATIFNDDLPTLGYSTPTSYAGMQLAWADEFQGANLNSANWTHETGDGCPNICGWGNNELEFYQSQNTSIAQNEYLIIEAKKENAGNKNYTSSRIITKNKHNFKYGRVDIRAVLPKGQGIWPALWMLGKNIDNVGWPACGEIDIMEIVGHEPGKLHGTVHWDHNGSYASYGGSTSLSSGTFYDKFHVFSITWDDKFIRWYLDDVKYHEIDISPAPLSEFQNEFFFIFNVAVGGNWPGSPNTSTIFPARMIVDYIRVFQNID